MHERTLTLVASLLLLVGCVPATAGYDDVKNVTRTRAGKEVRWHRHEKQSADKDTQQLLAKPLTVDSAVQVALLNNPSLQSAFEKLGIARAERVNAVRLPNPAVGAALRYGAADGPAIDLDATLSLSHFLLMPSRNGTAMAGFDAVKLEVAGDAIDIAFATRGAYFDYQATTQRLALRRSMLQSLKASLEMSEQLHEAGNITDLVMASQRALYEEARIGQARDEALWLMSREKMNAQLGLWGESATAWQAADALPEPPPAEDLLRDVERRAVSQSLDIAIAHKRFEKAARRTNLAQLEGWVPDLRAGVTAERSESNWSVGPKAEIELPIFYQGQGETAAAESEMRQERSIMTETAVRVRTTARGLALRLATASESIRHYQAMVLPLREEVVQQTQLQYNAMNASVFQLLQAKRDQFAAEQLYVDLLHDYWTFRTQLEQLLAGRLPSTGSGAAAALPADVRQQSDSH